MTWLDKIHVGDCRELMRAMIADGVKVNTVCTSPPYYGLRDYGHAGQIGLEPTFRDWLDRMAEVFELVRQLLADDGTLWLNLGDSYCGGGGYSPNSPSNQAGKDGGKSSKQSTNKGSIRGQGSIPRGLKPKDLMGQPWRVAFALQDAGWYLRRDIVWHKPNPMPESAKDRPTTSHEFIFLMAKAERYYFDAQAIAEPVTGNAHARGSGVNPKAKQIAGWADGEGSHSAKDHARIYAGTTATAKDGARKDQRLKDGTKFGRNMDRVAARKAKQNESFSAAVTDIVQTRNSRSVWTIPTEPFPAGHFATFPRELPRRCILAGCPPGGVVFDPFMGSGTVAEVALELGRKFIGTELNPEYAAMFKLHRRQQAGLEL